VKRQNIAAFNNKINQLSNKAAIPVPYFIVSANISNYWIRLTKTKGSHQNSMLRQNIPCLWCESAPSYELP
jgi:hypothetical protein